MIEVTGIDIRKIAAAAYDLSRPMNMGMMHYRPGPLDDEISEMIAADFKAKGEVKLDYVRGRCVKLKVVTGTGENGMEAGKVYLRVWTKAESEAHGLQRWMDHSDFDVAALCDAIGVEDTGA